MKVVQIALKDLLISLRDRKAIALIILMPIVLIAVLGVCLSSMFSQGSGVNIEKFGIAIVDSDGKDQAKQFKDFLSSGDMKKMIEINEMGYEDALDKVRKGDMPAAIVIPEGYSTGIHNGNTVELKIYKDPGSPLRAEIVESLVKSYSGVGSSLIGSIEAAAQVFNEYGADVSPVIPNIMKSTENIDMKFSEDNVKKNDSVSSMQYYAAAMLVMYIMFVGMLGTSSIIEEKEDKTLMRMMSAAVSKRQILTGKVLGLVMLGIFDVSVLILFTRLVLNVSWGNSIGGLAILSLSMIFAASGLAMLIASVFKTSSAANSASPPIIMIMSFLGGSMIPVYIMPPMLQNVAKITLNNWALNGYLKLMLNNGIQCAVIPSIVMIIMGVVFLTIGIMRLRLD